LLPAFAYLIASALAGMALGVFVLVLGARVYGLGWHAEHYDRKRKA
jgi:hypothetical protein